ncbi:splicing regulator SDE2 isoform X2 [Denticeps clupeoides]|uniref:splicing regulator SDE2 isoform X2 n=1 Tax=Denticeps clupeoides TaxID=299321 RepID=UPI0010A3B44E|nr:replication stress response regulator SDE2 isoform X2 [Denticeps clupeoides]
MDVSVASPAFGSRILAFSLGSSVQELLDVSALQLGLPASDFYAVCDGRISGRDDPLRPGAVYRLEPRLRGGKGGFGSMLRALGAQIEKTTNREACRDLSGRRLRDVNHEKEMAEWLKKQADREAEKEQRRLERLQRKMAEPKHYFTDPEYERQCHDLSERLEDSVLKGMQASSSSMVAAGEGPSRKRPSTDSETKSGKKRCCWMGFGGLEEVGSSEEDSSTSDEDSPSTSATSCRSWGPSTAAPQKGPSSSRSTSGSISPERSNEEERSKEPAQIEKVRVEAQGEDQCQESIQVEEAPPSCPDEAPPTCSGDAPPTLPDEAPPTLPDEAPPTLPDEAPPTRPSEAPPTRLDEAPPSLSQTDGHLEVASQADHSAAESVVPLLVDLQALETTEQLEALGLERLKKELMERGMKCGGTIQERAARLLAVRGLDPSQIDPALLAKPAKGKKK